jgi:2',3'-cyclic-nucleotide 2'-phosphodiesterase (5'-nucleotidase family)
VEVELTGAQLREVLEQGLTLERGLVQTSGLRGTYDLSRPAGRRLVSIEVGGRPLADARVYRVATNSFVAEGGDLYATFLKTRARDSGRSLADVVMEAFRRQGEIGPPPGGRFAPVPPPKPRRAK